MTYSNGASARQLSYDAIIKKTFTEINDLPTRRQKDNLLVKVKKVLVAASRPYLLDQLKPGTLTATKTFSTSTRRLSFCLLVGRSLISVNVFLMMAS